MKYHFKPSRIQVFIFDSIAPGNNKDIDLFPGAKLVHRVRRQRVSGTYSCCSSRSRSFFGS